jgi:ATP-dependent helicase HrpA
MSQEDILATPLTEQPVKCPDNVNIGGKKFPLKYSFVPGAEHDGVTMTIPVRDAPFIPGDSLGYLVPHLWPQRITELLQCLPKETRKKLMPLSEKARDIAAVLKISPEPFNVSVAKTVRILYGIEIDPDMFSEDRISPHLSLRVEVSNDKGEVVASGRDASVLSMHALQKTSFVNSVWEKAVRSHERHGITEWNFGDLADCIEIASSEKGIPLYGYPVLSAGDECVNLTMAKSFEEAQMLHKDGVRCLLEITLATEFVWVERELRFTQNLKLLCAPLGGPEKIKNILIQIIKEHLLNTPAPLPRKQAEFVSVITLVKKQAAGIGYEALSLIEKVILLYNECISRIVKESRPRLSELKKELKSELLSYIDCVVNGTITFDTFRQYPRYFKAFGFRIERAFNEPLKYNEKKNVLNLYQTKIDELMLKSDTSIKRDFDLFLSMLQEFAISLFAQQEVKTLFPISEKRLDKKLEEIGQMVKKIRNGK